MLDVFIVVEGGMVIDTFASEKNVCTTVIDLDAQNPDEVEQAAKAAAELREKIARGKLYYA